MTLWVWLLIPLALIPDFVCDPQYLRRVMTVDADGSKWVTAWYNRAELHDVIVDVFVIDNDQITGNWIRLSQYTIKQRDWALVKPASINHRRRLYSIPPPLFSQQQNTPAVLVSVIE